MGGSWKEEEQASFETKLTSEVSGGVISEELANALATRNFHIKRMYNNGVEADKLVSITEGVRNPVDQNHAMSFNTLYEMAEVGGGELDIDYIYNESQKIKNVHQAQAVCTKLFTDVDSAIEWVRYNYTDADGVERISDNHEVCQIRAKALVYIIKNIPSLSDYALDVAHQFAWLSQYNMLDPIKRLKNEAYNKGITDNSELSSEDIATALRFDREYNATAFPMLVELYGNIIYGTAEYNGLIEDAIKFDYYPQITLLAREIANARKANAFALPILNYGEEHDHESLSEIKDKKEAIIDMVNLMTPSHPVIQGFISQKIARATEVLQERAAHQASMPVRKMVNGQFVNVIPEVGQIDVHLSSDDIKLIGLATYRSTMQIVNAFAHVGVSVANALAYVSVVVSSERDNFVFVANDIESLDNTNHSTQESLEQLLLEALAPHDELSDFQERVVLQLNIIEQQMAALANQQTEFWEESKEEGDIEVEEEQGEGELHTDAIVEENPEESDTEVEEQHSPEPDTPSSEESPVIVTSEENTTPTEEEEVNLIGEGL